MRVSLESLPERQTALNAVPKPLSPPNYYVLYKKIKMFLMTQD